MPGDDAPRKERQRVFRAALWVAVALAVLAIGVKLLQGGGGDEKRGPEAGRTRVTGELSWVHSEPAGLQLSQSEVTVGQYQACVKAGACSKDTFRGGTKAGQLQHCNGGRPGRRQHPMNCVSWHGADAFCRWAGGRLPTGDEWYAEASNGGTRAYPWGDAEATCALAVMDGGERCGKDRTRPVCSRPSGNSVSGMCDMSGNVWEWTSDSEGTARVLRGGSVDSSHQGNLCTTGRAGKYPGDIDPVNGFRCARAPSGSASRGDASAGTSPRRADARPAKTSPAPKPAAAKIAWTYSKPARLQFTMTEVTLGQYRLCVEAGACKRDTFKERSGAGQDAYCNWGHPTRQRHPMNCVTWHGADAFCRWVGGRLPTESEWYAEASDNGSRVYPWGSARATCDRAVMEGKGAAGCGVDRSWPVCSRPAGNSVSGLCDMGGNVWEWSSKRGVLRGGGWNELNQEDIRASARLEYHPAGKFFINGIRCVRTPPGAPRPRDQVTTPGR